MFYFSAVLEGMGIIVQIAGRLWIRVSGVMAFHLVHFMYQAWHLHFLHRPMIPQDSVRSCIALVSRFGIMVTVIWYLDVELACHCPTVLFATKANCC